MSSSTMAATACLRCREQKLRCTREQPHCARCVRLGSTCTYPKPPDRKALASHRAQARTWPERRSPTTESWSLASAATAGPALQQDESSNDSDTWPGLELQQLLCSTYFACAFNSSLCVHRPSFLSQWAEGLVPRPLLLAICAMGSNFFRSYPLQKGQHAVILPPLDDLHVMSRQWALSAGRQTLEHVDSPTLADIQTCQILALYWCAVDDPQRNLMFSSIAYRAARMLGMRAEHLSASVNETDTAPAKLVERETLRRCLWAAWATTCSNFEHYDLNTSPDSRVMQFPLPISETAFHESRPEVSGCLSLSDKSPMLDRLTLPAGEISMMAELLKLVLRWARIRDHIEARKRLEVAQMVNDVLNLDQWLLDWHASLPPSFVYSQQNLQHQVVERLQPTYSLIFALFHQCRLVLYGSLVPQISGLPPSKRVPADVLRLSAQRTLESAQALSQLASHLMLLGQNHAEVAPFVGYCMYASACVHLVFLGSKNEHLRARTRANLAASMNLLEAIKPFWRILERLWDRVLVLRQARLHADQTLPEGSADLQQTAEVQLLSVRNDTGHLSESLAESMLQYSGERLRLSPSGTISFTTGGENAAELSTALVSLPNQPQSSEFDDPTLTIPAEWWDESLQLFPDGILPDELLPGSYL